MWSNQLRLRGLESPHFHTICCNQWSYGNQIQEHDETRIHEEFQVSTQPFTNNGHVPFEIYMLPIFHTKLGTMAKHGQPYPHKWCQKIFIYAYLHAETATKLAARSNMERQSATINHTHQQTGIQGLLSRTEHPSGSPRYHKL